MTTDATAQENVHEPELDPQVRQLIQRISNDFAYHPPRPGTDDAERHEEVRARCWLLAERLARLCPYGRELSLALTSLEETMMWANAAIARNKS